MDSLENGKIANMTVYDKDFLADPIKEVGQANPVCTITDGEIVYKV